jgi:hypothetical protein
MSVTRKPNTVDPRYKESVGIQFTHILCDVDSLLILESLLLCIQYLCND